MNLLYMQENAPPSRGRAFHLMPASPFMPVMGFFDVMEEEQVSFEDARRLQSFYPETAKRIQQQVEEECDRMEYEGSMMFDEYPDRIMIWKLTEDIMVRLPGLAEDGNIMLSLPAEQAASGQEGLQEGLPSSFDQSGEDIALSHRQDDQQTCLQQMEHRPPFSNRPGHRPPPPPPGHRPPPLGPDGPDDRGGLRDLIQVMLLDEMHRRRCRHRRCRRYW